MILKALDALRGWVDHIDENGHLGRLSDYGKQGLRNIADAIEAEIAERYIELPVGADGEAIKLRDEVVTTRGLGRVERIEFGPREWWLRVNYDDRPLEIGGHSPDSVRHIKPRTIEDVLQSAGVSVAVIEDVAAEIRELMGGDAR